MYNLVLLLFTANACTVNLTGSNGENISFDLSSMEIDENYLRDYIYQGDPDYDYFANICGETTMNCGFDGTAVAIQKTKGSVCVSTLAKTMGDSMQGTWLDPVDQNKGVQVTFNDGDMCEGVARKTVFNLHCSKGKTILNSAGEDFPGSCSYTFDFNTPAVCPAPAGSSSAAGSSNKGYSWGTIFLIGLCCSLVLYCGFGIYYKRK